jgi:hypothetical protein
MAYCSEEAEMKEMADYADQHAHELGLEQQRDHLIEAKADEIYADNYELSEIVCEFLCVMKGYKNHPKATPALEALRKGDFAEFGRLVDEVACQVACQRAEDWLEDGEEP